MTSKDLMWTPTSITIIDNNRKAYEGYPAPWDLFSYTLELIRINREPGPQK